MDPPLPSRVRSSDGSDIPKCGRSGYHGYDGSETPESRGERPFGSERETDVLDEVERLETGVNKGIEILSSLQVTLSSFSRELTDDWKDDIDDVIKTSRKSPIIIGVIGTTGAGKSSIINALLDEERLIPTSSMRACTSVATEISFNHDPSFRYKAEVVFRTKEEWRLELSNLYGDAADEADNKSGSHNDSGTFDKMHAVYGIKKADVKNHSVEELLENGQVCDLLGTTVTLAEDDARKFYRQLQAYVDNANRPSKANSSKSLGSQISQVWPLIRVVRVYVKASILNSGLTLVDLPGVLDINAGRSTVWKEYQGICSRIWLVMPITRAVDDDVTKRLLGDGFTTQLKADGDISKVTFICTKTDDINVSEVNDDIPDEDYDAMSFEPIHERLEKLDSLIKVAQDNLIRLERDKDEKAREKAYINEYYSKLDTALASPNLRILGHKRKSSMDLATLIEKGILLQRGTSHDCVEDGIRISGMTKEELSNEAQAAASRIKELFGSMNGMNQQIEILQRDEMEYKTEKSILQHQPHWGCIIRRNEFTRPRVKEAFSERIREDDEKDHNDDSDGPRRNYKALETNVPVYCVSSRAYQKLEGRMVNDSDVKGFRSIADTEVPQLRDHCLEFTKTKRKAACEVFLNRAAGLLNSIELRAASKRSGEIQSKEKKEADSEFLKKHHCILRENFDDVVLNTFKVLERLANTFLFQNLNRAARQAQVSADSTVQKWHSEKGGIAWNTYRAICRRDGVYESPRGSFNWNDELAAPLHPAITTGWEKFFQYHLPRILDQHANSCCKHIERFHDTIKASNHLSIAFENQLKTYSRDLRAISDVTKTEIKAGQRATNRSFSTSVQTALAVTYREAASFTGIGTHDRMKQVMTNGVHGMRERAFSEVLKNMEAEIRRILKSAENDIMDRMLKFLQRHYRDYKNALKVHASVETEDDAFNVTMDAFINNAGVAQFRTFLAGLKMDADGMSTISATPGPTPALVSGVWSTLNSG